MSASESAMPVDDLLQHADWVRSLARRLVLDAASADDLVQQTWVVALEHPPGHAQNLRAWLGSVVTSLAKSGWRSDARRDQREKLGARREALPSTEELVLEAARSRELVGHVLALEEPFRGVLLLRYFKGRTPAQIARELGRPVATVKTWLQRGHAKLRERLDQEWGDSRAWCAALLPLAKGSVPAASAWALVPLSAAAVVLVLAGWWGYSSWGPRGDAAPGSAVRESLDEGRLPGHAWDRLESASVLPAGTTGGERLALTEEPEAAAITAPSGQSTYRLVGRVVDLEGAPLTGVEVEWIDPGALRWADQQRSVVTGSRTWLEVSHEEQARLLAEPQALERFLAENFARPDLARALLLDREPPRYRTWTGSQGELELDVPELGYGLLSLDPEWGLIGRSALREDDGREAWMAARRRTVKGRVEDAQGDACAAVEVTLHNAYSAQIGPKLKVGRGFISSTIRTRTDESGDFQFEAAALAPSFSVVAQAEERGDARQTFHSAELADDGEPLRVELRLSAPERQTRVIGTVYTSAGEPSPRTTVVWGRDVCSTDERGIYEFQRTSLEGDLYAARAGWGLAVQLDAGRGLDPAADELRGPDLRLADGSLSITGRVLTPAGGAVVGASVGLEDGTRYPGEPSCLEDIAAGRDLGYVLTGEDGRFRIDGLRARDYRLFARGGDRRVSSDPTAAGTVGVELVLGD